MKIEILTQDNCPKCGSLKMYVTHGLAEEHRNKVEWVHKETNPKRFQELVEQHEIMTTPAIIVGEQVLRETTPLQIESFLKEVK